MDADEHLPTPQSRDFLILGLHAGGTPAPQQLEVMWWLAGTRYPTTGLKLSMKPASIQ